MFRALLYGLIPLVLASTDPQISTPSATATIPSFVVSGDTQAPTTPILVSPANGTITNGLKPEFVWRQSSDPNGNTLYYTLFLNDVATYLGISNIGNSAGSNYAARLDNDLVKLVDPTPFTDGTYLWSVIATDLAGNSSRSTIWNLTIDTLPPPLTLTQLDYISNPTLYSGANFDIAGPKNVYFTFLSDPFTQVQLNISGPSSFQLVGLTSATGTLILNRKLPLGVYEATTLAYDSAGNTILLPDFILTITQASIPIPGASALPVPPIIYNLPAALTHLPATLYQITSTSISALLYVILLAVLAIVLLILLSKRGFNLILLNSQYLPLPNATIYHSHDSKLGFYKLTPSSHGRIHIPHLSRYSSLTIRVVEEDIFTTHILSIARTSRRYTVIL